MLILFQMFLKYLNQEKKNKDIIELNNLIINSYKKQGEYNLNYIENIKTAIEDIKLYIEQNQQKDKKENKNDFNLSEEIRKLFKA